MSLDKHSLLMERTHLSAKAFRFGLCAGSKSGCTPPERSIARKQAQNLLSRSCSAKRIGRRAPSDNAVTLRPAPINRLRPPTPRREEIMPIQLAVLHHLQSVFTTLEFSHACICCSERQFASGVFCLQDKVLTRHLAHGIEFDGDFVLG